jgi:1,2-diacylglycerol 3-alpha-glucosyltransferase
VVGHLGRLSREKNLGFIVETMTQLMRTRPHVKLLLVGDGDRLDAARAHLADVGLSNRVIAPGMLEGSAAADAYAAMDLFVFASHSDTQGLVLAEAMSAGVPIIALDAPGARDCVDERVGCLLPATTSPQAFATTAAGLLEDRAQLQLRAETARQRAASFSRLQCLRTLLDIYERAVERHGLASSHSLRHPQPALAENREQLA